jgi:hypothetical protein
VDDCHANLRGLPSAGGTNMPRKSPFSIKLTRRERAELVRRAGKYQLGTSKNDATHPTPQNCPQMIPVRSRSDSLTFTPTSFRSRSSPRPPVIGGPADMRRARRRDRSGAHGTKRLIIV